MKLWSKRTRRILRRAALGTSVLIALEIGWHR